MDLNLYPVKYIVPVLLKDSTLVQLRPIHPLDGQQAVKFKSSLSPESIYNRFLGYFPKISSELVKRLTEINYAKEMAIIAEIVYKEQDKEIIAVARIAIAENSAAAEFAIIIADAWQGMSLGSQLTDYMIMIADDMQFPAIQALVFAQNSQMIGILRKKGFKITRSDNLTMLATKTFERSNTK